MQTSFVDVVENWRPTFQSMKIDPFILYDLSKMVDNYHLLQNRNYDIAAVWYKHTRSLCMTIFKGSSNEMILARQVIF